MLGVLGDELFDLPGGLPTGRFPLSSRVALGVSFAFAGAFFFVLFFVLEFVSLIGLSLNVGEKGTPLFLLSFSCPMFILSCCLISFAFCWSFAISRLRYYHSCYSA